MVVNFLSAVTTERTQVFQKFENGHFLFADVTIHPHSTQEPKGIIQLGVHGYINNMREKTTMWAMTSTHTGRKEKLTKMSERPGCMKQFLDKTGLSLIFLSGGGGSQVLTADGLWTEHSV